MFAMMACRAAIGAYVAANRGAETQKVIYTKAGVNTQALSDLELSKHVVSQKATLSLMQAAKVPVPEKLSVLYACLSDLIREFGGSLE